MTKKYLYIGAVLGVFLLIPSIAFSADDCKSGYEYQRMSGVGCVQIDCNNIPDAHYSYTQHCICGSSGSIYEDASDPNKECYREPSYTACPSCLYACVHADESCPGEERDNYVEDDQINTNDSNTNSSSNVNQSTNTNSTPNQNINVSTAGTNMSLSTTGNIDYNSCDYICSKFTRGKKNAVVTLAEGTPPNCKCQIDIKDDLNRLNQTINVDGNDETTFTFDPETERLIKKTKINRKDESEKIRIRLGYKYTQEQIDKLLASDKVDEWFNKQIKSIKTATSKWDPQYWWQHMVAIWDHGFNGNSADFVDTYEFGRCGDSMLWLERDLTGHLDLSDDKTKVGQKHEAILSITGESYGNMLNHTSILVRPQGISNVAWEDLVKTLKTQSGGTKGNSGIANSNLKNIAPEIMDAKVLDPYKKEITTVREFIKGWSYIRIS
ncbi:hypothetical protein KKB10_00400 [Patescibacteria group bacterium]|nr:hypothetical protein [Patescibacteria group bacterium]MBU1075177.1 hypothetical protein [Patescibacteria group bacterium]MBU1951971.1 hypothetical protein [Patescibacteria group bacterium]